MAQSPQGAGGRFDGKVALVTGGSSGIGEATALMLAARGAKVAAVATTRSKLDETADRLAEFGGEGLMIQADVSDADAVRGAFERTVEKFGRLDFVLANAGINGVWTPIEKLTPDEWDRTLSVNLRGTFLTVKYAVPHLKRTGGSAAIVSSVNGTRMFSNVGASAYATSKAGQVAFAKMMALELAPDGVRVNAVCPGAIETMIADSTEHRDLEHVAMAVEFPEGKVPLTQGRAGSADQVAEVICWLASDAASHVSGSVIFVDGAQSLFQG